jgi:hypothetical protein
MDKNKFKQFNWEMYSQDPIKWKVYTMHGLEATQLTLFNAHADKYPMRCVIQGSVYMHLPNGKAAGADCWSLQMCEKE